MVEVVRIGLLAPISGPNAGDGQDFVRGVGLAIKEANAKGGVAGSCGGPFINNAYCHAQDYGTIWKGPPHDFPQGGHVPFLDCADEFNAAFAGFPGWVLESGDAGSDRPGDPDYPPHHIVTCRWQAGRPSGRA